MSKEAIDYDTALLELQVALVRYQQWAIEEGVKDLIVFEGRDGAGKDGSIKRITEHLAARNTRVVALPKPSDRERTQWYFQRFAAHLPGSSDLVIFNRSWYNRAGVEPVMGFCTEEEHEDFLRDAPAFERMLQEANIRLIKLWLDISKDEQAERLTQRRTDPLKALKVSPLDAEAQKRWHEYSKARDDMLLHTHTAHAPWVCVHADKKRPARLNIMRHLLHELAPAKLREKVEKPDKAVLFVFEEEAIADGRLAR